MCFNDINIHVVWFSLLPQCTKKKKKKKKKKEKEKRKEKKKKPFRWTLNI